MLQTRFATLFSQQLALSTSPGVSGDGERLAWELEETRARLESSSLGLGFLIKHVQEIANNVAVAETLSDASQLLLRACAGRLDDDANRCLTIMAVLKQKAADKRKKESPLDAAIRARKGTKRIKLDERGLEIILESLRALTYRWRAMREALEVKERRMQKVALSAAAIPSTEALNRIARAEGPAERRFYKALVMLLALKNPDASPKNLGDALPARSRRSGAEIEQGSDR
jgi:hypothetical protein